MLVKVLNRCTRDGCIYVELLCVEVSCCSLLLCNYNQVDSVTLRRTHCPQGCRQFLLKPRLNEVVVRSRLRRSCSRYVSHYYNVSISQKEFLYTVKMIFIIPLFFSTRCRPIWFLCIFRIFYTKMPSDQASYMTSLAEVGCWSAIIYIVWTPQL